MTLTEFLLARIAEDEAVEYETYSEARRVLAECEAKRRIVEWDSEQYVGYAPIKHLAVVYSDHPDYDEAWRP